MNRSSTYLLATFWALGCGGSCPCRDAASAETESEPAARREPAIVEPIEAETDADDDAFDDDDRSEASEPSSPSKVESPAPEPDFPADASVSQAIEAIPRDSERLNVDRESLEKPLQNPGVYAPCNPGTQSFTIKVAVWDGRAVGVDVITKNEKLRSCLDTQIRELSWKPAVRSLNTIEIGF